MIVINKRRIGDRIRLIAPLDRGKEGWVIPKHQIPTDGRGIPQIGGGHYKPIAYHDVAVRLDDGTLWVGDRVVTQLLTYLDPEEKCYPHGGML